MALTPEDVVKKEFPKPRGFGGTKGYDEIQVDDFLDEIVVELRRLNAENEELSSQLEDCRRSKGLPGKAAVAPPATAKAASDADVDPDIAKKAQEYQTQLKALQDQLAGAKQELAEVEAKKKDVDGQLSSAQEDLERTKLATTEQEASNAKEAVASSAVAPEAGAATVIALAQKLHDQHVAEGQAARDKLVKEGEEQHASLLAEGTGKRDNLVSEGESKRDELVGAASQKSETMVREAEEKRAGILAELEAEKSRLTQDIDQLRGFEHNYRTQLKDYITGQLEQLDSTGVEHQQA